MEGSKIENWEVEESKGQRDCENMIFWFFWVKKYRKNFAFCMGKGMN
jgi:hypothetical protein